MPDREYLENQESLQNMEPGEPEDNARTPTTKYTIKTGRGSKSMKKKQIFMYFLLAFSINSNAEYSQDAMQAIGMIKAACAAGEAFDITLEDSVFYLVNPKTSESVSPKDTHGNDIVEGLRDEHQILVAGLSDPNRRDVLTSKRFCIESHIDRMMNAMVDLSIAEP